MLNILKEKRAFLESALHAVEGERALTAATLERIDKRRTWTLEAYNAVDRAIRALEALGDGEGNPI